MLTHSILNRLARFALSLFLILCSSLLSLAQPSDPPQTTSAPVTFKGDTLFMITHRIGAFSPAQRAEMVSRNIQEISKRPVEEYDSLIVLRGENGVDIYFKDRIINSVTMADVENDDSMLAVVGEEHRARIQTSLVAAFNDKSAATVIKDIAFFILALLGLLFVFWSVNRLFDFLRKRMKGLRSNFFFRRNRFVKIFDLIGPDTERAALLFLLRMGRFAVIGIFFYLYLPFMFSQISYTRGVGEKLLGYVLRPLRYLGDGLMDFLPDFLFIVVVLVAVRYLLKGIKYVFLEIRKGDFNVSGFYPDWAIPTFNLLRVLIMIFTLVVIFPYLPGSDSSAFQGISVFVGLLLSLGSAGVIGNVISGIVLTYMRPFKAGDRVEIGHVTGDVISKNLLVTRLRTTKNEEVTIPNGTLLGGGVINYSTMAEKHGVIIHSNVTIGYDAPWKQVHQLLENAALKTPDILQDPPPFILQKSLDDWYVSYEVNAYTKESHKMPRIYSHLHANIQDEFNAAGVEIMSPHYQSMRDGNRTTIPATDLPPDYRPPTFGVKC